MGKAERNRKRRRQRDGSGSTPAWAETAPRVVHGGTPAAMQVVDVLDDIHMPCRTAFTDDPLFGGPTAAVTGIRPDGRVLTDATPTAPGPVVLFEPPAAVMIKDTRTGTVHEARTEGIISSGFHRMPRGLLVNFPAEGWSLHRTATGLMLRDGFGGIWAQGTLDLDPAWVSEATSHGWVTVFFGPRLGIRVPPGTSPGSYTWQQRIAEFRQGRSEGLCAAASVKWHPEILEETTDWVLLPTGALGQPLPLIYLPQFLFTHLGGPEAFGFARAPEQFADVPIAAGLAAAVTPVDVDLFQPHLDDDLNFVGGYRAPGGGADPRYTAWHASAHAHGKVLVITGHQDFPASPQFRHTDPEHLTRQVMEVVGASYAAIVPVSETRRSPMT